jgi:hypothetical protein
VSGLGPALRRKTFDGFAIVRRGLRSGKDAIWNRKALQAALS